MVCMVSSPVIDGPFTRRLTTLLVATAPAPEALRVARKEMKNPAPPVTALPCGDGRCDHAPSALPQRRQNRANAGCELPHERHSRWSVSPTCRRCWLAVMINSTRTIATVIQNAFMPIVLPARATRAAAQRLLHGTKNVLCR